jgi:glutathione peroxidase
MMNKLFAMAAFLAVGCLASIGFADDKGGTVPGPLSYKMPGIDGKEVDLSTYKGKVVLFVNVASRCGKTPQYKGLEALYEKYKDQGLVVIGVPANDFGAQEPGTDAEIAEFCTKKYNVTFPMLAKVSTVKGANKVDLYKSLTAKGGEIKWNFTKFLVGRNGEIVARYEPGVEPDSADVVKEIEAELAKK